jgi:RNA polymerase sigma-70 factor (ECF subfamily)
VLVLRDVMRWRTDEVATLLDATEVSVKSLLQRARATMATHATGDGDGTAGGAAITAEQQALLDRYVEAFERYDVDELVRLLRHDATLSMPPHPLWLRGAASISRWWRRERTVCSGSRFVRVAANGVPALAQYRPAAPGEPPRAFAVQLVTVADDGIAAIDVFLEPDLFPLFGLPLRYAGPGRPG